MRKISPEQVEELKKCRADVLYFVTQYCYLKHTTKGKIKWDHPYDFQVNLLQSLQAGEDIVVCKSRRIGASWTCCAYALWRAIFFPDVTIMLLSRKERYAIGLLRRIKFMLGNLPYFLRPKVTTDTKSEIIFTFRVGEELAESNILSLTTTDESGRGEDAALILVDEAAFVQNAEETWASIGPTAAFGGQRVIISTPNGVGNFFHRLVVQLRAGQDIGFIYIEAHWKHNCGLSDAWFKKATAGLTAAKILQEFELQFLSTGAPFFDLNKLALCYKPPDEYPQIKAMMIKTEMSFTGVDTSEGHAVVQGEPDYHAIVTLNEYGVQIYAFYSNSMSLKEFAGHTMRLPDGEKVEVEGLTSKVHREYPGIFAIERWGSGDVTASRHETPDDEISNTVQRRMTNASKMRMLNSLRLAIIDEVIVITDLWTYTNLQAMEDQSTGITERAGAAKGMFDDMVIGLMLAWNELKKHGGYTFDFSSIGRETGQRMVAMRSEGDLPRHKLKDILPVGPVPQGPMFDMERMEVPGEYARLADGLEEGRHGRTNLRPPGM